MKERITMKAAYQEMVWLVAGKAADSNNFSEAFASVNSFDIYTKREILNFVTITEIEYEINCFNTYAKEVNSRMDSRRYQLEMAAKHL
jgi:hypothetical protein